MEIPGKIQAVQYIGRRIRATRAKGGMAWEGVTLNCANCGRELVERGCKVRCSNCGYFEDCSDPSAPGEWSPPGSDAPDSADDPES
jgi:hypothetical protein